MQKFLRNALSVAAIAVSAAAPAAIAATIEFEDSLLSAGFAPGESFSEAGFTMSVLDSFGHGQQSIDCLNLDCPANNTSQWYFAEDGSSLAFTRTDALAFTVASFDASYVGIAGLPSDGGRIQLTGLTIGGATLSTSFELGTRNADNQYNFTTYSLGGAFAGAAFTNLSVSMCLYAGGDCVTGAVFGNSAEAVFALDNISITAVPEPSTWALMAFGIAGVGLISRRRRAQ